MLTQSRCSLPPFDPHNACDHSCPECSSGDLDFAADGDGRWDISWHFVPCDGGDDITYIFEGSNEFYWKIQPRGGKVSVYILKYTLDRS